MKTAGETWGRASALRSGFARPGALCIAPRNVYALTVLLSVLLSGCGYHVAGTTNLLPAEIHTIAVTPWRSASVQYKLSDYLGQAVTREMITRTHYKIVADPAQADAVLSGSVGNMVFAATVADPTTGRSSGAAVAVQIQVRLTDKSGKVLFDRPTLDFRERYEISVDPKQYFDESQAALQRLSQDVARTIVTAILTNF